MLTGNGPAFCAGADSKVRRVHQFLEKSVPYADVLKRSCKPQTRDRSREWCCICRRAGSIGAADIVVTDANALFSFSEVRIGVIPAVISVVCMPKLGRHHAMKLFVRANGLLAIKPLRWVSRTEQCLLMN